MVFLGEPGSNVRCMIRCEQHSTVDDTKFVKYAATQVKSADEENGSSSAILYQFTSDVGQRKQGGENNRENEHNSDKTKKNFTGSYTEVNPGKHR